MALGGHEEAAAGRGSLRRECHTLRDAAACTGPQLPASSLPCTQRILRFFPFLTSKVNLFTVIFFFFW